MPVCRLLDKKKIWNIYKIPNNEATKRFCWYNNVDESHRIKEAKPDMKGLYIIQFHLHEIQTQIKTKLC